MTASSSMHSGCRPIRVAQIVGKMNGGGVEAVVMNYYRHIDRSRVQFDFLVNSDSMLIPSEEIAALGGRVFEIPPYQRVNEYQSELLRLFKQEGWMIVHSHVNALSVFPLRAAKKADVPVRIAHSHSTSGKGEHAKNVIKAVLKTQSNRYPTDRFACSRVAGEWLFGEGSDFEIVYNAIELRRFYYDAAVRAETRANLGLADGQFAIGHVGRFTAQKNHRFLIDLFSEVARHSSDAVLLLVGSGVTRPLVESRIAELGIADRVKFLGQRVDVERLYQAFDAFVLPSLYEGLGVVAIEAQAAGLPCFLSDTITREVDVTGTCRFLPINNPDVWADAICHVERHANDGRISVQASAFADYDIDRQGERLTKKYLELIGRTHR